MKMSFIHYIKTIQISKTIQLVKSNFTNRKSIIKVQSSIPLDILHSKHFNSSAICKVSKKPVNDLSNEKSSLIMLKLPDNTIISTTLLQAKTMSSAKKLKLVKIDDANSKSNKPLYKLMSKVNLQEENVESEGLNVSSKKQNSKHIRISTNIGENDLRLKIKNMMGFLKKNLRVTASINGAPNPSQLDEITKNIVKELQPLCTTPKQNKTRNLVKLLFIPSIEDKKIVKRKSSDERVDES